LLQDVKVAQPAFSVNRNTALRTMQMRHAKMRRAFMPTSFGPGTGYRVLENTMPIRNMLRDPAKLDQFRATGTIEGVQKVTVPVPGCPARTRMLTGQPDDEVLVIETVGPSDFCTVLRLYSVVSYPSSALTYLYRCVRQPEECARTKHS
jgi:hypothetical protein